MVSNQAETPESYHPFDFGGGPGDDAGLQHTVDRGGSPSLG